MSPVRIDSHVHAWCRWPYVEPHPPETATVAQLVDQLDKHQMDSALVVCADIDPTMDNNSYVADEASRFPGRLLLAVDVDSHWCAQYHTEGALSRLSEVLDRHLNAVAVTHYVRELDDGWFESLEGRRWLDTVERRVGVLSLATSDRWADAVARMAGRHPNLRILWHHFGGLNAARPEAFDSIGSVAVHTNVYVKVSGLHYVSSVANGVPWLDASAFLDPLAERFGADRLCWGSDFPASLRYTSYDASLAAFEPWLARLSPHESAGVMGENLARAVAG